MKVLMINKFLHANGGSETYIFKLGDYLKRQGHEVQYFGMEHKERCVGNRVNAYTSNMDFHDGSKLKKLAYPVKTIYSSEAKKKIRLVLDDFQPDICHLNNFTYHLTPSIILEIRKWMKKTGHNCRIIFTAHDYNLLCPNHMLHNPNKHQNCEKCLGGHFINCVKGRCIHGSRAKSLVGAAEAYLWNWVGIYGDIDKIICCSEFMKSKMDTNPVFASKTEVIHNFIEKSAENEMEKQDYVLYFGRFSLEKGIATLLKTCELLPDIPFVFAGSGPLEKKINLPNVRNVGFKSGKELDDLICAARFSLCPSEVYENCPFSVMESQERGVPVIGARIGGIPELISDGQNGRLFEDKNYTELAAIVRELWDNPELVEEYGRNCKRNSGLELPEYGNKLYSIYKGGGVKLLFMHRSEYVLYFGRYSEEKGIGTLIEVCKELPEIPFIFAGSGPLKARIAEAKNIRDVGFRTGKELTRLVQNASFSVCPSEWYENCPFSVMESQLYGTPVLGAKIGGIPELIRDGRTGELFDSGNRENLKEAIKRLWENKKLIMEYRRNCHDISFYSAEEYAKKLFHEKFR